MRKNAVSALRMTVGTAITLATITLATVTLAVLIACIPGAGAGGLPAQWVTSGPYGGYIYDMAVSAGYKSDRTIFAATDKGVYKSIDVGSSWSLVNSSRVMALAVSPDYPNDRTIFAGYYRSTDGGASWSRISVPVSVSSLAISPDYAVDRTIFAGGFRDGLARSSDGGLTWTLINTGLTNLNIYSIAISPDFVNDRTIFAGTDTAFFKSTNRGESWTGIADYRSDYPETVVISPNYAADRTILVGFCNNRTIKSTDGGVSWINTGISRAVSLAVSPDFAADQTLFAGTRDNGVFKSTDGGESWNPVNTGLAIDWVQSLCISPDFVNDQTIFAGFGAGSDGIGIYKSTSAGDIWSEADCQSEACGGLDIPRRISSLAISPDYAHDQTLFAGPDRNDVFKSTAGSWSRAGSAVGNILAVSPDYASDRTVFAASWNACYLSKSTDGGHSWVRSNAPSTAWWDLAVSPGYATDQTLFAAGNGGVYKSTDGGLSWAAARAGLSGGSILEIEISPDYANDQTLFAGTGGSGVFKSEDGGAGWTRVGAGSIYSLAISPNYAADRTIFAVAPYNGIYRSGDGGQSWNLVFSHYATAIGLSPDYAHDATIFAYDGRKVVMSQDGGETWSQIDTPPGLAYINMIAVSPDFVNDRSVFFSTAEGVWAAVIGEYVDTALPVAVCRDAIVRMGAAGRVTVTADQIDGGSSDNCGLASRSVSPDSFTCADMGDNSVVLTVEDLAGNVAQCTATVTVLDGLPPVPDLNPLPEVTAEGEVTLTPPTATDNCAGTVTATTTDPLTYNSPGTCTVTWIYSDSQGNMAVQTQRVIVTARAKISVWAGGSIQAAVNEAANGAVITVRPGVYRENINFLGKTITLKSMNPTDPLIVASTIIDGGSHGSVVTFDYGAGKNTLLSGMTIRNGEGGIACYHSSSPTISHCTITGNMASSGGGVRCCQGSSPTIVNCTISGNAASLGGGLYCGSADPTIINCTITGNAASLGSGIYCYFSCPRLTNCILWNGSEIYSLSSAPAVTFSDVQGGYPGAGNIWADPLFLNPAEGNYLLKFGSPCIDTATGSGVPGTGVPGTGVPGTGVPAIDKNGLSRPAGDGYDMGAYEYLPVDDTNPPVPDLDPLPDITAECEVTLIPPTATDEIAGSITATTDDPLTCNTQGTCTVTWTYDDGQGNTATQTQNVILTVHDTLRVSPGESIQAVIETACNGTVITVEPGVYRENINFLGKNITLKSIDPTDSEVVAATIIDGEGQGSVVTFNQGEGNSCVLSGMSLRNGRSAAGGGIYCYSSSPAISNCNITGNSASSYGGALYCRSASPSLTNCVLAKNSASSVGGAIYCYSSSPELIHCTMAGNSAPCGAGIRCYSSSSPVITNCILWNESNESNESSEEIYSSGASYPTITFSDLRGGYAGSGNIEDDPLFLNAGAGDYHLHCDSPCIDRGIQTVVTQDRDGVARPEDGDGDGRAVSDMGACEYVFGTDNRPPDLQPLADIVVECAGEVMRAVALPTATDGCTGETITATDMYIRSDPAGSSIVEMKGATGVYIESSDLAGEYIIRSDTTASPNFAILPAGEYTIEWVYADGYVDPVSSDPLRQLSQTQKLTLKGITISKVSVVQIGILVTIKWRTDVDSTGEVHYSTDSGLSDYLTAPDYGDKGKSHQVVLDNVVPRANYYFEVQSGATIDNNDGQYYRFDITPLPPEPDEPLDDIVLECGEEVTITPPTATTWNGETITATLGSMAAGEYTLPPMSSSSTGEYVIDWEAITSALRDTAPSFELPYTYTITWMYDDGYGSPVSQIQNLTARECQVPASSTISEVTVSNQTARSATIVWRTDTDNTGEVHYSTDSTLADYLTGAAGESGKIHRITLSNLTAGQTWYFEVQSGTTIDNNDGQYYRFSTAQSGLCDNFFIGGKIIGADTSPRPGDLVLLTVNHQGVDSCPLSSTTNRTGIWFFNLADLKDSSTGTPLCPSVNDPVYIKVLGAEGGAVEDSRLISDLTQDKNYTLQW